MNGSAGNVGTQIVLASGALLTVNANGTFNYDPNGAFLPTPTAGSGASNTPAHDSFTYTLAGGNTVTVTITLTGLDTDDVLFGTAGVDVMFAGAGNDYLDGLAGSDQLHGQTGNDVYTIDYIGDQVFEAAGEGNDLVYAATSYALGAGQEIEALVAQDNGATVALNLTGNEYANTILGNAGANALDGGAGADVLAAVSWRGRHLYGRQLSSRTRCSRAPMAAMTASMRRRATRWRRGSRWSCSRRGTTARRSRRTLRATSLPM